MNRITYVGHATLLLELDGLRLVTDPLLTARVSHLTRLSAVADLDAPHIDAVLLSHLHADHVHLPSLRRLGRDRLLVAPRGSRSFLARHGFRRVVEMIPGATLRIDGVDIEATPADHPGRTLPGRPKTDCLGYLIHGSHHIYFTGDTDLFPGMATIGESVDIALLPVWGWGPTLGVGHMNPYRAAKALELLQPAVAIPIHWGTYFPMGLRPFLPHLLHHPPQAFAEFAARLSPRVRVFVLDPGQGIDLTEAFPPSANR